MSEMNNNTVNTKAADNAAVEDMRNNYTPQVHRIGRVTMAIAFVLVFMPILYFLVVMGYVTPLSSWISVTIAVCSAGIGMWVSEPLAYWPVLGSAGTYIAYLSGNVGAMRFPVALNLQSQMKADVNTPRGQIVTVVGIVASVFANLVLLLLFVIAGSWLTTVFPAVVLASFSFVMHGLLASLYFLRWGGEEHKFVKNFVGSLPYIVIALVVKLLSAYVSFLENWGMLIAVVLCLLCAYYIYKRDCKKDEETNAA